MHSGGGDLRAHLPKRTVTEQDISSDPAWRAEVLAELENQPGGLGTIDDLPPAVVNELKELKLYELFAESGAAPAPSSTRARPAKH